MSCDLAGQPDHPVAPLEYVHTQDNGAAHKLCDIDWSSGERLGVGTFFALW